MGLVAFRDIWRVRRLGGVEEPVWALGVCILRVRRLREKGWRECDLGGWSLERS